jgi:DNA-binding transcriptional LysR family regulator
LTLEVLAEFPMIVAEGDTGNSIVDTTFRKAGIVPRQILSAINADLSKGYVEMGIGVGVMVSVAFDSQRDHHLRSIPVGHLFPSTQLTVAMRPNTYLREYMLAFVQMYAPELSVARIRSALSRVCT